MDGKRGKGSDIVLCTPIVIPLFVLCGAEASLALIMELWCYLIGLVICTIGFKRTCRPELVILSLFTLRTNIKLKLRTIRKHAVNKEFLI